MTLLYNPDQNYLIPRLLRNTVCAVYLLTIMVHMFLSRLHVNSLCNFDNESIASCTDSLLHFLHNLNLFAMGADRSFELKIIEIWAPVFFKHNN